MKTPEICIPNISLLERRKRLIAGAVMLFTGFGLWLVLVIQGVDPLWRLALFPVFAGGATSYFQWRDET